MRENRREECEIQNKIRHGRNEFELSTKGRKSPKEALIEKSCASRQQKREGNKYWGENIGSHFQPRGESKRGGRITYNGE